MIADAREPTIATDGNNYMVVWTDSRFDISFTSLFGRLLPMDLATLTPQVVGDTLGALLKYQDDIARMQGDALEKVLKEATNDN